MARIEYKRGIECKRCGNIIYRLEDMHSLCQECGAHIIGGYSQKMVLSLPQKPKELLSK